MPKFLHKKLLFMTGILFLQPAQTMDQKAVVPWHNVATGSVAGLTGAGVALANLGATGGGVLGLTALLALRSLDKNSSLNWWQKYRPAMVSTLSGICAGMLFGSLLSKIVKDRGWNPYILAAAMGTGALCGLGAHYVSGAVSLQVLFDKAKQNPNNDNDIYEFVRVLKYESNNQQKGNEFLILTKEDIHSILRDPKSENLESFRKLASIRVSQVIETLKSNVNKLDAIYMANNISQESNLLISKWMEMIHSLIEYSPSRNPIPTTLHDYIDWRNLLKEHLITLKIDQAIIDQIFPNLDQNPKFAKIVEDTFNTAKIKPDRSNIETLRELVQDKYKISSKPGRAKILCALLFDFTKMQERVKSSNNFSQFMTSTDVAIDTLGLVEEIHNADKMYLSYEYTHGSRFIHHVFYNIRNIVNDENVPNFLKDPTGIRTYPMEPRDLREYLTWRNNLKTYLSTLVLPDVNLRDNIDKIFPPLP